MIDKYATVECLENDLDAVGPSMTDEQFVARRQILAKVLFPLIEQKSNRIPPALAVG